MALVGWGTCQAATVARRAPPAVERRLADLAAGFDGDVGLVVADLDDGWVLTVGGVRKLPQQSVAKLWTAIAVLAAVDAGRLDLDQSFTVTPSDLSVYRQPMAARVGRGGGVFSMNELLRLAISESDNAANDILVRVAGGGEQVRRVLAAKGVTGVSAGIEQGVLQSSIAGLQWQPSFAGGGGFEAARRSVPPQIRQSALEAYLAGPPDGASPVAIASALAALQRGRLLSAGSTTLLLELMRDSSRGRARLAAGLPRGWSIAHKTGTGPNWGGTYAGTNDVGLITAPDGRTYAVAVMIGRSRRSLADREGLAREVARTVSAAWATTRRAGP